MRFVQAAGLIFVVLASGACGGGNDGKSFAEQADAICSDAEVQIGRISQPQDPRDPAQLALFLERAVPVARAQNAKLKQLERPEDDRDRINQFLGALEAEVDAAERMLAAARREDRAGIQQALQGSGLATGETERLARRLGLEVCGLR